MSNYNTDLQTNNTSLEEILETINNLPETNNDEKTYKYIQVNFIRYSRYHNIIHMGNESLNSIGTSVVLQSELSPSPLSFPNDILTRAFATTRYCLENSFIIILADFAFGIEISGGITEIYNSSDSMFKIYHIPSISDDNITEIPTITFLD